MQQPLGGANLPNWVTVASPWKCRALPDRKGIRGVKTLAPNQSTATPYKNGKKLKNNNKISLSSLLLSSCIIIFINFILYINLLFFYYLFSFIHLFKRDVIFTEYELCCYKRNLFVAEHDHFPESSIFIRLGYYTIYLCVTIRHFHILALPPSLRGRKARHCHCQHHVHHHTVTVKAAVFKVMFTVFTFLSFSVIFYHFFLI